MRVDAAMTGSELQGTSYREPTDNRRLIPLILSVIRVPSSADLRLNQA